MFAARTERDRVVGDNVGRVDSADMHLGAGRSSTGTTINVTGTLPWTALTGDLPFDINVGGERMTVTNNVDGLFTVIRSVNGVVKAQTINTRMRVWTGLVVGL